MTVTWTSGYNIDEAVAFVEWGPLDSSTKQSPAGTMTYTRNTVCGMVKMLSIIVFMFNHHKFLLIFSSICMCNHTLCSLSTL